MDDLSFFDHEPAAPLDDIETRTGIGSRPTPATYRAASVLDGLTAHAAVFDCSAGCTTADT